MAKLILLDSTEFVKNARGGMTKLEKVYKCGDKRFRIRYENSNGAPLGFNYKKCLSQYNGEKWNNLDDISVLKGKIDATPSYFSEDSYAHCEAFFKLMEARILNIYS